MKTLKIWLITIAVLLYGTTVSAYDFEVDGIYYNILSAADRAVEVTKGDEGCYSNEVVIPETVTYNENNYHVTRIGVCAFMRCDGLINITIPNSVESVGELAFYECPNITNITIPNSVISIENDAFQNCLNLAKVTIPSSVRTIGPGAFVNTKCMFSEDSVYYVDTWAVAVKNGNLGRYSLRENTTGLSNGIFEGCTNLVRISLPESLKYIGNSAFRGCTGLKNISFPKGIKNIGEYAFSDCSNITDIVLPDFLINIQEGTFAGCSNLLSVAMPQSLKSIEDQAFRDCIHLSSIDIPASVKEIGAASFSNCFELSNIILSDSITIIGGGAFFNCSISDIVIPSVVTTIGDDAFYNNNLTCVTIKSPAVISKGSLSKPFGTEVYEYILDANVTELPDFAFYNNMNLRTVVLPETLTTIGEGAFEECVSLDSITIPANVTEIKDYAFSNCTALKYIACEALVPPTCGTYTFDNVDTENCILEVPASAVNAYATTAPWSEFNKKVSLVDGEDYENETDTEAGVITYSRTLNNLLWNALYVPFEIPVSQLTENYDIAYINAMHSYDMDDNGAIDKMEMEVVKIKEGTLHANYPYLIRAKNEEAKAMEIVVENSTLYAAESVTVDCSSVFTKFEITGTYQPLTNEDIDGCYALSDGAWKTMPEDATLNPFRLYMRISDREGSPVKVDTYALERTPVTIRVQGEEPGTTSIESEEIRVKSEESDATIYNLMGQPVKNPVKGHIYIQGGRKVVW